MPQPTDLATLTVGSRVQDTFLVMAIDVRTLENGDPYTVLTLGNGTGTIVTEPFWIERHQEVDGLRRGHAVQVIGEVRSFRERRQLRVTSLRLLPPNVVDFAALLPSVGGIERYWETLDGWRRDITKPRLRAVVDLFYEEDAFRQRYEQCPAATRGHHAALGGLLKHTTEVAAIGRTIARACGADLELVVAGALLHDIGKLDAYRWDGLFDYTEAGRLQGHVALGALMFDRRLREESEPPCTAVERDILLHYILSHHGRLEYGSPVPPLTLEAEVLHQADNASAKAASMADALRDPAQFPDGLTSVSQRLLDGRRVWRGESDWGTVRGEP